MNRDAQKQFINDLCNRIKDELTNKANRFPESWDGVELRQLIAMRFADNVIEMSKTRKKNFENTIIVQDI